MTLLREVMERPLDPGYATAAARRAQGETPGRRALVLTLVLALVCGAVTARAIAELRRPQPGAEQTRAALQAEVRRRSAAVDAQQKELDRLRAQVAALQARSLADGGKDGLAGQVPLLGLVSAESPVAGPGLKITMNDAASAASASGSTDPRSGGGADQGRVLDRDLQIVVNGLWAAGAEAISVNGQRLTARTAIRYAGQAILVDFRPLVPPYVVSAIGDPSGLQTRFAAGSAGEYLQALRDNYGVQAAIVSSTNLELPGAGAFSTRFVHARNASSPPLTAPSGAGSRGAASPGTSPSGAATSGSPTTGSGSTGSASPSAPAATSVTAAGTAATTSEVSP
ncbi:MAG: DUF881 domain-containing protein [Kineosporiaceae bacterium]